MTVNSDVVDGVRADLRPFTVGIESLTAYPGNPRKGHVPAIVEGLRRYGQYKPLVVQARTGHILVGNHTWQAAQRLGWTQIAVVSIDVDDDAAARIVAFDNRSNDFGSYDGQALVDLLGTLPDLEGTGYSREVLAGLIEDVAAQDGNENPFDGGGAGPAGKGPGDWDEPVTPEGGDASVDEASLAYRLAVECDTREQEDALLQAYSQEGYPVTRIFGSKREYGRAKVKLRPDVQAPTDTAVANGPIGDYGGAIHPALQSAAVSCERLVPFAGNPRRGDVAAIRDSLLRHGQYRPIVVRPYGEKMQILAGNHTFAAACELAWASIAVTVIQVGDEEAARIVAWDNRAADLGGYDEQALGELLGRVEDLGGTGYNQEQLGAVLDRLTEAPPAYGVVIDCEDEEDQVRLLGQIGDQHPSYRVRAILT